MAHVGYGYAVTPELAVRTAGSLLVLGPADAMGSARNRVVACALVRTEAGRERNHAMGPIRPALDKSQRRRIRRALQKIFRRETHGMIKREHELTRRQ